MARRLLLALICAVALLAPAGVFAQEPQASLPDIEDEVMCPICGVSLELATEAPQAQQEREFIRTLIAEGLTKDEIKDRLVAEYGSEVLATPEAEGFDLAAWLVPGAAIVIAGGAIFTVRAMEGRRIESLAVDLHSVGDRRGAERVQQSDDTAATPQ